MEGYSIRGQVEKLKSYVSAKSWSIYDVYLDEGISGKDLSGRPAVNRMIDDIKAGHVKNVLIYKLDRLTRSVSDLSYLIDLFKQYDCAFNSLTESVDTSTASGRLFIKFLGIFAEFERENIGERVRLGKERKAKEGFTTACRNSSYGYDREYGEKVQRINKAESVIVQRIFDMFVNQNLSLNKIAKTLNQEQIPCGNSKAWYGATISRILTNCNYAGYVRYALHSPERYFESEGKHEPIIDVELFQQAQLLIEKIRETSPTKKPCENNYFSGIAYCGVCGIRLQSNTAIRKNTKPTIRFICNNKSVGVCNSMSATLAKVERAVIEYMSNITDVVPDTTKAEKAKQAAALRVAELQSKIENLENKQIEVLDRYIEEIITVEQYRDIKVRLDTETKCIKTEIEQLTPPETNIIEPQTRQEIILSFNENWNNFNNTEKRQFLLKHIKKVIVINHPQKGTREGKTEILNIEFYSQ